MALYSAWIGKVINITYRAGAIVLDTTGILAADSGKSIFLEEHYLQQGDAKTFRWEIPYPSILKLNESLQIPHPPISPASRNAPRESSATPLFDRDSPALKNPSA